MVSKYANIAELMGISKSDVNTWINEFIRDYHKANNMSDIFLLSGLDIASDHKTVVKAMMFGKLVAMNESSPKTVKNMMISAMVKGLSEMNEHE